MFIKICFPLFFLLHVRKALALRQGYGSREVGPGGSLSLIPASVILLEVNGILTTYQSGIAGISSKKKTQIIHEHILSNNTNRPAI